MKTLRRLAPVVFALFLSGLGCGTDSPTGNVPSHKIQTVFVIVMENHKWASDGAQSIKDNASAPYINRTLLPMSSYATNYFNPPQNHPSLPNYLWLEAGTNFGIFDDNSPFVQHQSTHQHLVALLLKTSRGGTTTNAPQAKIAHLPFGTIRLSSLMTLPTTTMPPHPGALHTFARSPS